MKKNILGNGEWMNVTCLKTIERNLNVIISLQLTQLGFLLQAFINHYTSIRYHSL